MQHDTRWKNYRIADSHSHIYPAKIAEKATHALGDFYSQPMSTPMSTADNLVKCGATIGVERFLVSSAATVAKQVSSVNNFIASECALHPQFIGLGTFHQDCTDIDAVLDEIDSLGLRGVKLHADFQKCNIDDERLIPLYEEMARRGQIALLHVGDDRYDFSNPARLAKVLEKVPDLKCIAAHLGGWKVWPKDNPLRGSQAYFDECSSLDFISPEYAEEQIRGFGTDRVMFGMDFPMWDYQEDFDRFMKINLSEDERKMILYDNFATLFQLDKI